MGGPAKGLPSPNPTADHSFEQAERTCLQFSTVPTEAGGTTSTGVLPKSNTGRSDGVFYNTGTVVRYKAQPPRSSLSRKQARDIEEFNESIESVLVYVLQEPKRILLDQSETEAGEGREMIVVAISDLPPGLDQTSGSSSRDLTDRLLVFSVAHSYILNIVDATTQLTPIFFTNGENI